MSLPMDLSDLWSHFRHRKLGPYTWEMSYYIDRSWCNEVLRKLCLSFSSIRPIKNEQLYEVICWRHISYVSERGLIKDGDIIAWYTYYWLTAFVDDLKIYRMNMEKTCYYTGTCEIQKFTVCRWWECWYCLYTCTCRSFIAVGRDVVVWTDVATGLWRPHQSLD